MAPLRPNFALSEFACPCCGVAAMSDRLLDGLQELRDMVGVPVYVTTKWGHAGGYRCTDRNALAGGHPKSRHMTGEAADIHIKDMSVIQMYIAATKISAFKYGGIGIYPDNGFVHLDVGRRSRWGKIDGVQVPVRVLLGE